MASPATVSACSRRSKGSITTCSIRTPTSTSARSSSSKPSRPMTSISTLTGKGFGAFAMAQPDTPGKLVAHAFSYEHMEEAAYDLLAKMAERAGDSETVETAREIELQEHEMGDRLATFFDRAADAALRE